MEQLSARINSILSPGNFNAIPSAAPPKEKRTKVYANNDETDAKFQVACEEKDIAAVKLLAPLASYEAIDRIVQEVMRKASESEIKFGTGMVEVLKEIYRIRHEDIDETGLVVEAIRRGRPNDVGVLLWLVNDAAGFDDYGVNIETNYEPILSAFNDRFDTDRAERRDDLIGDFETGQHYVDVELYPDENYSNTMKILSMFLARAADGYSPSQMAPFLTGLLSNALDVYFAEGISYLIRYMYDTDGQSFSYREMFAERPLTRRELLNAVWYPRFAHLIELHGGRPPEFFRDAWAEVLKPKGQFVDSEEEDEMNGNEASANSSSSSESSDDDDSFQPQLVEIPGDNDGANAASSSESDDGGNADESSGSESDTNDRAERQMEIELDEGNKRSESLDRAISRSELRLAFRQMVCTPDGFATLPQTVFDRDHPYFSRLLRRDLDKGVIRWEFCQISHMEDISDFLRSREDTFGLPFGVSLFPRDMRMLALIKLYRDLRQGDEALREEVRVLDLLRVKLYMCFSLTLQRESDFFPSPTHRHAFIRLLFERLDVLNVPLQGHGPDINILYMAYANYGSLWIPGQPEDTANPNSHLVGYLKERYSPIDYSADRSKVLDAVAEAVFTNNISVDIARSLFLQLLTHGYDPANPRAFQQATRVRPSESGFLVFHKMTSEPSLLRLFINDGTRNAPYPAEISSRFRIQPGKDNSALLVSTIVHSADASCVRVLLEEDVSLYNRANPNHIITRDEEEMTINEFAWRTGKVRAAQVILETTTNLDLSANNSRILMEAFTNNDVDYAPLVKNALAYNAYVRPPPQGPRPDGRPVPIVEPVPVKPRLRPRDFFTRHMTSDELQGNISRRPRKTTEMLRIFLDDEHSEPEQRLPANFIIDDEMVLLEHALMEIAPENRRGDNATLIDFVKYLVSRPSFVFVENTAGEREHARYNFAENRRNMYRGIVIMLIGRENVASLLSTFFECDGFIEVMNPMEFQADSRWTSEQIRVFMRAAVNYMRRQSDEDAALISKAGIESAPIPKRLKTIMRLFTVFLIYIDILPLDTVSDLIDNLCEYRSYNRYIDFLIATEDEIELHEEKLVDGAFVRPPLTWKVRIADRGDAGSVLDRGDHVISVGFFLSTYESTCGSEIARRGPVTGMYPQYMESVKRKTEEMKRELRIARETAGLSNNEEAEQAPSRQPDLDGDYPMYDDDEDDDVLSEDYE